MPSTGRTTFVNTLCGKPVLEHKESDDPSTAHIEEGVKIEPVTVGALATSNAVAARNMTQLTRRNRTR